MKNTIDNVVSGTANLVAFASLIFVLLLIVGYCKISYGLAFIENKEGVHLVYLMETEAKEDLEDNYVLSVDKQGVAETVNVGKGNSSLIIYRSITNGEIRRIEEIDYSPVTDHSYFSPYEVYEDESNYNSSDKATVQTLLADYEVRSKTGT